ncbi:hypothetical protein GDO86_013515, partial [Hymenochirus boettgeri]
AGGFPDLPFCFVAEKDRPLSLEIFLLNLMALTKTFLLVVALSGISRTSCHDLSEPYNSKRGDCPTKSDTTSILNPDPGNCPDPNCTDDNDCLGCLKCCPTQCGKECSVPTFKTPCTVINDCPEALVCLAGVCVSDNTAPLIKADTNSGSGSGSGDSSGQGSGTSGSGDSAQGPTTTNQP